MKKLKPSLRDKKRYILLNEKKEVIERVVLDYLGILGWAKAAPRFLDIDGKTVLAIKREEIDNVRAAFELGNIKILRVSGTIKGLKIKSICCRKFNR